MLLRFTSGCGDFQLEEADVQWHPDNLLARLTSTAPAHSEGGVSTWELGSASDTPFALPGALPLTVALFKSRGRPLELEVLSQLLAQFKPRDISLVLQTLPDYLGLPGSPSDYLPAEDQIPLQHAGVLDLHVYPLASTVAQQIMDSLPFRRDDLSTWSGVKKLAGTQPHAARYLLCHRTVSRESLTLSADQRQQLRDAGFSYTEVRPQVEVYQVHMPPGPWPLPNSIPDYEGPSRCIMDEQSQFELLSAPTVQGTASLTSMGALFGAHATSGLDGQTALGRCVAAELEEALSKVGVQGSTGVLQLECIPAWAPPKYSLGYRSTYCPLWAITW